jgi:Kef-type K+ transport system membrane component KefB
MLASLFEIDTHLPLLMIVGGALLFGAFGGRLFQKLKVPQVVGYIIIGVGLGGTGLNIINEEMLARFHSFNDLALGIIGFLIGGELHRDVFKKYGKQFGAVLCTEGLGAFAIVSIVTGTIVYFVSQGDIKMAIAVGIVLGGISSATAPAATVQVLKEYKTRGALTSSVFAIVALDDGLALILYGVTSSIASQLIATGEAASGGILGALGHAGYELGGALFLGVASGFLLNMALRHSRDHGKTLTLILGSLGVVIGAGLWFKVDVILAAMVLGVTIVNLAPRRSSSTFEIVERFAPPIYVLFFVLVGAHLKIIGMAWWLWVIVGAYVLGRSSGKIFGARLGAILTKAPDSIKKYLGWCLFCQGGVAIGLALLAGKRFAGREVAGIDVGTAIMTIVTATTFIVELLGPPFVKIAVTKSGEVGLNVTEADLMGSYRVGEMMDDQPAILPQGAPLALIFKTIADTDAMTYPVVDENQKLAGIISVGDLKQSLGTEGLTQWLVAFDLMHPPVAHARQDEPLEDAVNRMEQMHLDCMPVLAGDDEPKLVGMLELRAVNRKLSQEILHRRQLADTV